MTRAVVFAYHDVGVRCLRTLLAAGIEVSLLVTHQDNPAETIWFDSVERHARWHGIPVITPADPNTAEVFALVELARPDFLFSFYYRSMLKEPLLQAATRGAYNMHGSLLPKYRGRVPVNWAVLNGERETGATLHVMTAKPDAGAIVAQQAVPILPDDLAVEVFRKVTVAAEIALACVLPALIAGTAEHRAQDLAAGSYFGGRTAKDGGIDWRRGAQAVHNLVRAVAPPYPGAFSTAFGPAGDLPLRVLRTRVKPGAAGVAQTPRLRWCEGTVIAECGDGVLELLEFELGDVNDAARFRSEFGDAALPLRAYME